MSRQLVCGFSKRCAVFSLAWPLALHRPVPWAVCRPEACVGLMRARAGAVRRSSCRTRMLSSAGRWLVCRSLPGGANGDVAKPAFQILPSPARSNGCRGSAAGRSAEPHPASPKPLGCDHLRKAESVGGCPIPAADLPGKSASRPQPEAPTRSMPNDHPFAEAWG